MLQYIIQIIAFQLLFLIIYDLFLKRETFFNWNRAYLLTTALLSLILPFIKIGRFKNVIPQIYVLQLPEINIGQITPVSAETSDINALVTAATRTTTTDWSWSIIFYLGLVISAGIFLVKLYKLVLIIQNNPRRWKGNVLIVTLLKSTAAFSFFHYIFLGEKLDSKEKTSILKHELIHVKQNHTLDLLIFEVLRIALWFNPLVYMLLSQVFETQKISFINTYFKESLIKKRIVMLSKSKSKKVRLIKYTLLIPMVLGMLAYTSSNAQDNKESPLKDKALYDKFYEEIKKLNQKGTTPKEIIDAYSSGFETLDPSKEDYYKHLAYKKYTGEKIIKMLKEDPAFNENLEKEAVDHYKPKYSYKDFLAYLKTEDGLKYWGDLSRIGVIKQVVKNLKNLSSEEALLLKQNKELINNDKFLDYYKLIITDGESLQTFENPKKRKQKEKEITDSSSGKIEVPFAVIQKIPTYSECESLSPEEEKKCVSKKISKHIIDNFNIKLANSLGLVGEVRINTLFKISKEGNIEGIRARAPLKTIENEAIRVIATIPKMKPGMHKGKPVIVPYSLPIVFQVHSEKKED